MPEVEEYFVDSGVRPGFPGNHGPGWYLVDYVERTIRPKPIEQGELLAQPETPPDLALDASGEQSEANKEESVASADEAATPEAETTPSTEAQQPMEVVATPEPSVPTESEATQPEQE